MLTIIGIDPGLVHTGVVALTFNPVGKWWTYQAHAILSTPAGIDIDEVGAVVHGLRPYDKIIIEAYRPRSHFNSDERMTHAIQELRKLPGASTLLNTGVRQVVTNDLLKMLNLYTFSIVTNHQDLRSAARIALYAMLKDDKMNTLIADIVIDQLSGDPSWRFIKS